MYFFFNDSATPELYTLSLHDALPIWPGNATASCSPLPIPNGRWRNMATLALQPTQFLSLYSREEDLIALLESRSEEHTSELQSHVKLVCRLLLEKKKKKIDQANMKTM